MLSSNFFYEELLLDEKTGKKITFSKNFWKKFKPKQTADMHDKYIRENENKGEKRKEAK